jgi:hypothetical protein
LENSTVTDASLRLIVNFAPGIRVLDISKCTQITEKGLLMIVEHCKELRYLGLKDVYAVTDAVVALALQLPHLLRLDLDGTYRLTDGLCKRLTMNGRASFFGSGKKTISPKVSGSVEELSLAATPLSPTAIPTITSLCPRLHSLNLSFCPQLSDSVLSDIIQHTPTLDSLVLRATPGVTDSSLPLLQSLISLLILENPQFSLPAIRKLVTSELSTVKVYGADLEITLLRNSSTKATFSVNVNEFDSATVMLDRINAKLIEEGVVSDNDVLSSTYNLRRVTYRKNGTKRPGLAHVDADYGNLVRELVEKKHHVYLDQNPTSVLRLPGAAAAHTNDLFLTLRMWDSKLNRPCDLRDVSLPSIMTLADLKACLYAEGALPCPPEKMFIVEEETDLRTNILATDAMSISMCGIISGDILHLEEITDDKLDATQQIVHSWTGAFLSNRPVVISVQETDDSFHRRRGRLTFLSESTFKFELKLKASWSFAKLKNRIARKVGVAAEYLRISTRVEPLVHLQAAAVGVHNNATNNQSAIDVIGGNLWLLLEIDSAEMLAEKIPISVHHFAKNGLCNSVQTILVRKTTNLKGLKEKIAETLHIPEELQLISRISSRDVAPSFNFNAPIDLNAPRFVRQVYTQNSAKLNQLNLHHIRVDEMERPIGENDLILQTIQFGGWKSGFKTCAITAGTIRLIALPAGSKFNEVKAAIASNCAEPIDIDTMTLKLAGCSTLQRDLMFEIKPKYFEDNSTVVASTIMRPLDIVCWSDSEF